MCEACGQAVFPLRALCPRCGGRDWRLETAEAGTAEQVTGHRAGGAVASVATDLGPVVIARVEGDVRAGGRVSLDLDGGAPVVRPEPG